MGVLTGRIDWSLEPIFINNPTQTYFFGQPINVGLKFQNKGSTPILLTRVVAWFDWLSEGQHYSENRNTVYSTSITSPFLAALELPQFQVTYVTPLDAKSGHHNFKFGVQFSYWSDNQWKEADGIQWAKSTKPVSDRVLVAYPPPRAFYVFVSHSEADKDLTQRLDDYIKKIGQQPYIAESPQNPDIGKKLLEEKINGAILKANVMVLLWTNKSSMSQAVRYEINYARRLNKRILVALQAGMNLPQELQGFVYASLDYGNEAEALKLITKSLLQYEAEFQEQQRNSQAFGAILALLALAYFKS